MIAPMQRSNALTFLFCLLAPISIAVCLIVLGSTALTFVVFYLGICTLVPVVDLLGIHRIHRTSPATIGTQMGFTHPSGVLRSGILTGLLFGAAIVAVFTLFRETLIDEQQVRRVLLSWKIDRSVTPALFVVMIAANPVFEEFYWRGFIIHRFRGTFGPSPAILLSALFYASYHVIPTGVLFGLRTGILLSLPVFAAGVFWGWLRCKTGSLLPVIVSHLLADVGIMVVYGRFIVDLLPDPTAVHP